MRTRTYIVELRDFKFTGNQTIGHTRPLPCPGPDCHEGSAQKTDTHGRLCTAQKAYVEQEGIPYETKLCPTEGSVWHSDGTMDICSTYPT